ncbi:probable histone-lysine N-methyltransferase PRDM7 [Polyodon spathula]|uniref:probable histone-lysine N-methyltransferase PRDM7 n=1 Tax=Polyodon spathula TaxID=7913 RepID=UPI001B7F57CD|nr:probable histone-lysine N-methyltransferase PRDM7 [Polyodon spathula]
MKRNYEAMIAIGLNSLKPSFMCRRSRSRQPPVEDSSDPDEDWTPRQERAAAAPKTFRPPYKRDFVHRQTTENVTATKVQVNSEKAPVPSSSVAGPSAETPSSSTSSSDENRGDSFEGFTDDELAAFLVCGSPSESEESGKAEIRRAEFKAARSQKDSRSAQNSSQASTGNCYSLRKKLRILYEEIDEPSDDDYLCECCKSNLYTRTVYSVKKGC